MATASDRTGVPVYLTRDEVLGSPTYWKISDFGVARFWHDYDEQLLGVILEKALAIKEEKAFKRHLDLKFIRGAQRYIPEINEVIHDRNRLERLSSLAGAPLEPYPVSVISAIITFMGPQDDDGTVGWHCDGVPVTELVPLALDAVEGGALQLYKGNAEIGMWLLAQGAELPSEQVLSIKHKMGHATLGHFIRMLHRTEPIKTGHRVTLNLNLRSREKPFVDDNDFVYLGADNPGGTWEAELLEDIYERQLPAYQAAMGAA